MKNLFLILFLSLAMALGCQKKKSSPIVVETPTVVPAPVPVPPAHVTEDVHGIAPALYYVPILNIKKSECDQAAIQPIKNSQGDTIARLCETDYKECLKQGTCLLNEANGLRMINFTTRRGKVPTLTEAIKKQCPYGVGMKSICLDPYYTLAADLNSHKLGEVVYVPTIRGIKLPNGEIHNGYFIIRDSSANLKSETRFDFFTGFDADSDAANEFKRLGLGDKENRFKFEKVNDEIAEKMRAQRSYPRINRKQQVEAAEYLKKVMARAL